jgi:hypothetical protein
VPPSMKLMLPTEIGVAPFLTVAVRVTDWPNTDGLADDVSVVVESA